MHTLFQHDGLAPIFIFLVLTDSSRSSSISFFLIRVELNIVILPLFHNQRQLYDPIWLNNVESAFRNLESITKCQMMCNTSHTDLEHCVARSAHYDDVVTIPCITCNQSYVGWCAHQSIQRFYLGLYHRCVSVCV